MTLYSSVTGSLLSCSCRVRWCNFVDLLGSLLNANRKLLVILLALILLHLQLLFQEIVLILQTLRSQNCRCLCLTFLVGCSPNILNRGDMGGLHFDKILTCRLLDLLIHGVDLIDLLLSFESSAAQNLGSLNTLLLDFVGKFLELG